MTRPLRPCPRIRSKTASPSSSQTIASPSMTQDLTGRASIGRRARARVRARIRKPSCLIS